MAQLSYEEKQAIIRNQEARLAKAKAFGDVIYPAIKQRLESLGVERLIDSHESPNKYNNVVSGFYFTFDIVQGKYRTSSDSFRFVIDHSARNLFIPDVGYFRFTEENYTADSIWEVLKKHNKVIAKS